MKKHIQLQPWPWEDNDNIVLLKLIAEMQEHGNITKKESEGARYKYDQTNDEFSQTNLGEKLKVLSESAWFNFELSTDSTYHSGAHTLFSCAKMDFY